jgi:hypothetical protein
VVFEGPQSRANQGNTRFSILHDKYICVCGEQPAEHLTNFEKEFPMKQQIITNDLARKAFLQSAVRELENPNQTYTNVPRRFIQSVNSLLTDFSEGLRLFEESRRNFKNRQVELKDSLLFLSSHLRFTYASLRLHAKSDQISSADLERFGLSIKGELTAKGHLLERFAEQKARQVLDAEDAIAGADTPDDGDTPAPSTGLALVPNRSLMEAMLTEIAQLREQVVVARAEVQRAREALQVLRLEFQAAFVNLRSFLAIEYRGQDPLSKRNAMRAFGYRFKGDPSVDETPAADDTGDQTDAADDSGDSVDTPETETDQAFAA